MAHMIERLADGTYSHAYAGEVPWHGLGKSVPHDLTPEQILVAAGCDWGVEKQQLYRKVDRKFEATDNYALVRDRDNKILDYVSPNWEPLQNAEAFGFFHDFVMEGDMEMNTAGSLRDGQVVWALAKIKEPINIFNKDVIQPYLLFTNPHRFGQSIDVRLTNIRVVCNNTLTFALGESTNQVARMTHRRKFDADEVKRILGIADYKNKLFVEGAKALTKKKYNEDILTEYFSSVFPKAGVDKNDPSLSKNAKMAMGVVESQPGANLFPGSLWNMFNAVTFLGTHEIGREADTRLHNQWFGSTQKTNISALNKALEYVK